LYSLSPANDTDPTVRDASLAVLQRRVTVAEACTAMRGHGSARITSGDVSSLWDLLRLQDQRFAEPTGIGAVLERHRATHIRATEEVRPGQMMPADTVAAVSGRPGDAVVDASGDVQRRQPS
jgi:hypothetical protein